MAIGPRAHHALVAWLSVASLPLAANGVVVRHDVDDAAYREKGGCAALEGVGRLLADGELRGTGTLICDRWVLTSAHVVHGYAARTWEFATRGGRRPVEEIFVNPGWTGDPDHGHDLALLRLETPLAGVGVVAMFRGSDDPGTPVELLGYGYTGDGRGGVRTFDGALRAATNVIEEHEADYMMFFFDEPGSRYETPREGMAAFNDSGGPVIVSTADGPRVAGTHSFIRDWNENGVLADYGDVHGASRVTLHLDWLDGVLAACPSDLDGSGVVGFADILRVLSAWGTCGVCIEDVDGSGEVDLSDVVTVLTAWGPCS